MSSIDESLKLKLIKGSPLLLQKTNAFFLPKTVGEIIDFGYTDFLTIFHFFTLEKEDLKDFTQLPQVTVFFYFLLLLNNDPDSELSRIIQKGFYFFIGAENLRPNLIDNSLLFDYNGITDITMSEEGFAELAQYINMVYNGGVAKEKEVPPQSEAERRFKEKFDRLRKEREAAKQKKGGNTNFSDMLGGYVVRNYSMTLQDVLNLPYYAFFFLLRKLQNYDEYDLQLRAMLAGADVKDKLHHWISNTDDEE